MRALSSILLAGALTISGSTAFASTLPDTIPEAIGHEFTGSNLRIVKDLGGTSKYTRHSIRYEAGDLTISGIMTRPRGKGPFPVVVLAHGYIDPDVYVSGQGFRREQDWLARNGYVALHVDYRNHASSDKDPENDRSMRLGYAEDVIGAALAVRGSELPFIDTKNVALLGRSMGGGVAYQALVLAPGVFDAAITYASTSTNAVDNFNKWQRNNYPISKEILARYGEPRDNPAAWRELSSRNYFSRITEPVLAFHGTKDEECDIVWARSTKRALDAAGVENRLVEYKGAGHYFYGPWTDSIRKVDRFLAQHLTN
jgi:dipeptidyl aminopeptidase/acylaminoacyl peptidase